MQIHKLGMCGLAGDPTNVEAAKKDRTAPWHEDSRLTRAVLDKLTAQHGKPESQLDLCKDAAAPDADGT